MKRALLILSGGILLIAVCWHLLFSSSADGVVLAGHRKCLPSSEICSAAFGRPERDDHWKVKVESPPPSAPDLDDDEPPEFEPFSGPGWRLWGSVYDTDIVPVENAEVEIWFFVEDEILQLQPWLGEVIDSKPIASARTDALGRYSANLSAPALLGFFAPSGKVPGDFFGRVRAAGFLSQTTVLSGDDDSTLPDPSAGGAVLQMDFDCLDRGVNLWGRVVDAAGEPVFRAQVNVCDSDDDNLSGESAPDGIFSVPLYTPTGISVEAYKESIGANTMCVGDLSTDGDATIPDIALSREGVIEGSVIYENGLPAADVWIWASHEYDRDDGIPGTGLGESYTRTGPDGRFRLCGLKRGYWSVEAMCAVDLLHDPDSDEDIYYEPGDSDLCFEVYEYRLRINLFDGSGKPVPHARLNIAEIDREWFTVLGGSIRLEVAPGTFTYNVVSPGWRARRGTFVVDEGLHGVKLDIFLEELANPGRIAFAMNGPGGEEVFRQLEIYFANRTTGEEWRDWIRRNEEGRYLVDLPAGIYDLDIASGDGYTLSRGGRSTQVSFTKYYPCHIGGIAVAAGKSATVAHTFANGDGTRRRLRR